METVIDVHGHIINRSLMPDSIFFERIDIESDMINALAGLLKKHKTTAKVVEWIIDHTYKDVELEKILNLYFSNTMNYLQTLLGDMDSAGVDKMVLLMLDLNRWDNTSRKLEFYKECRFFNMLHNISNGRLIGFIGLDLDYWLQEYYEDSKKALKLIRDSNGIKLYPKIGYRVDDDIFSPFFEYCQHTSTPITTHTSHGGIGDYDDFGSPSRWGKVLTKYPELYLNMAHSGGQFTKWTKQIIRLCMEYQNIYMDTGFHSDAIKDSNNYFDSLINLFDEVPDRILLGSDYPLHTVYYSYKDIIDIYRNRLHPFYFGLVSHYNPSDFITNR